LAPRLINAFCLITSAQEGGRGEGRGG